MQLHGVLLAAEACPISQTDSPSTGGLGQKTMSIIVAEKLERNSREAHREATMNTVKQNTHAMAIMESSSRLSLRYAAVIPVGTCPAAIAIYRLREV